MTSQKQDPSMHQLPDEYILYVLGCVDQYRCEKKSKTTPQVEDTKQQTKMVHQDMVIKRVLQHAHDVNTLQRQLMKGFF